VRIVSRGTRSPIYHKRPSLFPGAVGEYEGRRASRDPAPRRARRASRPQTDGNPHNPPIWVSANRLPVSPYCIVLWRTKTKSFSAPYATHKTVTDEINRWFDAKTHPCHLCLINQITVVTQIRLPNLAVLRDELSRPLWSWFSKRVTRERDPLECGLAACRALHHRIFSMHFAFNCSQEEKGKSVGIAKKKRQETLLLIRWLGVSSR